MSRLVVATTNRGKVAELQPRLASLGWEACGLDAFPGLPEAVEDGATFAENARRKARHYASLTGRPALADDSGLCVAALDGAPGIRSARYAGEDATDADNIAKLVEALDGCPDRAAWFACALCLVDADGRVVAEVEGRCDGHLLGAPRGDGGFGYDPLFVPDDPAAEGRTFAEVPRPVKQALSHRGRALEALERALAAAAADGGAP